MIRGARNYRLLTLLIVSALMSLTLAGCFCCDYGYDRYYDDHHYGRGCRDGC